MRRPRRLRPCTVAVLALFLVTSAQPRAGVYFHHHAGGGHVHVHPWGEDAVDHDHDHAEAQHHHHHDDLDDDDHDHVAHDGLPGLAEPDGDGALHAHAQAPFQQATRPHAAHLVHGTIVGAGVVVAPSRSDFVVRLPTTARGPPSLPS